MRVPLARSEASFLPILPTGIGSDELHDFGGRMQAAVGEIAEGAPDVAADDYAADVENKGADGCSRHGYSVGVAEARRARNAPIIAGRMERKTTTRMTQWMRWLMLGTERPRRYPPRIMLPTQKTPPKMS